MSYDDELTKTLCTNVVIDIDGVFYGMYEPDSGLTITEEYLQVKTPRINGVTVDVRKTNSPIGTFSFKLMEYNFNETSTKIMLDDTQLLEKDCIVYSGHRTGSFDFADYIELARTKITAVTKIANGYSIITKEVSNLIAQPALNRADILTTFILEASTTLSITDASEWPNAGILKVENEFINYTGKDIDGVTLTGLTRGLSLGGYPSTAVEHEVGAEVLQVTSLESVNPVDMILQILLSKDGDLSNHGTYDVLENGLGIAPDNVDIAALEATRDENFTGELHSLYIFGADNMVKYLEKFLLPATGLRFIPLNGKIAVSLLDEVNFDEEVVIIDESSIVGTPTWGLTSDKLVNVIEVKYDYDFSKATYKTISTFRDADSIATFGEKKTLKINMPSIRSTLSGEALAAEKAGRLLGRLAAARGKVNLTCHFDKSNLAIGSNVQVVHRFLPQQGGTLGFSDQLEIMSKSIDLTKSTVKYKLEFTSYTGIRIPFIGPSPQVTSIVDQKTFVVTDAACLTEGDKLLLFRDGALDIEGDPTAGDYLPDGIRTIELIDGNEVTIDLDFVTPLVLGDWIKLPDYDEATLDQKTKYAFIGENTGFFNDGSKSYQIIF